MIDFNDTTPPLDNNREAEREELRAELLARLESVLATMFPAGKKRKGKFLIGDALGSPGDSLEVVLDGEKAGLWTDRATGDGGDIFTLISGHFGIDVHADFHRVLEQSTDLLGRARSVPARKAKKEAPVDDLGPATAKWDYLDTSGHLIAVVYRYDPPGQKKQFRPWDAKRRKMAPPDPRPLFNQPGMKDAAQVVLVEGEKCAQALIERGIVATTAMHGANAPVDKTDWSPLSAKAVLIWPDRDKPGWEYATQAAQAILSAGAKSCHILYPPEEAAEGWDVATTIGHLLYAFCVPSAPPQPCRPSLPGTVCRAESIMAAMTDTAAGTCPLVPPDGAPLVLPAIRHVPVERHHLQDGLRAQERVLASEVPIAR